MPIFPILLGDVNMNWFSVSAGSNMFAIPFPKSTSMIHSNQYLEDLTEKMHHMLGAARQQNMQGAIIPSQVLVNQAGKLPGEAGDFFDALTNATNADYHRLKMGSVYQSPDLTDLVFYKSHKRTLNVNAKLTCASIIQSNFCKDFIDFLQLASLPRGFTQPPRLFDIRASSGIIPNTTHNKAFFPHMTQCVLEELGVSTLGHPNMFTSHASGTHPLQYNISMIFREKSAVYNIGGNIVPRSEVQE